MNKDILSTTTHIDLQFDKEHLWHPYTSMANALPAFGVVAAKGVELQLQDGKTLIDGTSSWWACVHGYSHPKIVAAMQQQAATLSHVMFGGITHRPAVELARLLVNMTSPNLTKVFLADSGSIAVEVAMKMALQYWQGRAKPNKQKILTIKNGYHGDTFAAMSVCDPEGGMHTMFGDLVTKQLFAPAPQSRFDGEFDPEELNEIAAIFEDNHQQIAALLVEPIMQGAGGMRFYHPEYLSALRKLCDKYDVLLILDEIATGFGRTGKLFAYEHSDIEADILCLGKALTGGYISLAATLCSDEVAQGVSDSPAGVFMHGPTFMGNPLACSAAIASLELLQENIWQKQIKSIETQLKAELAEATAFDNVKDVRVLGGVGVLEMNTTLNTAELQQQFVDLGVWIRPFSNLIYIMPPYCITSAQLSQLTHAMKTVAKQISLPCNESVFISHG
ncbi:adenosylmethionine--8-amino-7-oxononanoate transaminase [Shewanella schlegeliana]|uniref:Adenosylmethionine-8-amino-7-oxononanoate aminotransferase n=1 Tax=Shewanella schlegeliana TaxID=190308 RepID=A0ABS1T2W6_9GAMM|nr:adenosylmethionine--8-amino-7-oxononanoate transaminase [Shewanella schlegeliana]MBL4915127.1 adenosylmethionine--8-amino-7-oxononanoate transaminase [Shewanella schlegeliana]MCL1111006.1 adenosylmethionine--8-amino-7-oxononanoate transaminase [Shewanella schlegeliana]GIU29241.1 adenosylmethionine--8-amino-7-oxononanoate aminotransferase BioA [Shewanella schlegeliana]